MKTLLVWIFPHPTTSLWGLIFRVCNYTSHPNNIHGNLIQHFFLTLSGTNKKHILNVNFKKQSNHYKVTQNEVQSAGVRSRKKRELISPRRKYVTWTQQQRPGMRFEPSLLYPIWAVQWSWFARGNALCNISRKKSREVAASLPGRFLSRLCFTLCITVEVEPRIAKQYKCHHCCSCKKYRGRGMEGGKKVSLCCCFWLTRRSRVCEGEKRKNEKTKQKTTTKKRFGASYSMSNK